jgi:hypothetical protein
MPSPLATSVAGAGSDDVAMAISKRMWKGGCRCILE